QLASRHGNALMGLDMRAQRQGTAPREARHPGDIAVDDIEVHQHRRCIEAQVIHRHGQVCSLRQRHRQRPASVDHRPMTPVLIWPKLRPNPPKGSSTTGLPRMKAVIWFMGSPRVYLAVKPPSRTRQLPTANELSSLARKTAPSAISRGSATRLI